MIGLGTIVNGIAVIIGGILGIVFKKLINERIQDTIIKACGLAVLFIGMAGALSKYFVLQDIDLKMIACLILGSLIGEFVDIEGKLEQFGEWLKQKTKNEKDNQFLDAFITSSLTICIGAMAIVGAINDGLYHDYSILFTKSILDFIIILVMASSMGKGCIFSFIPVVILQGSVTFLALLIEPFMTEMALMNLSLIGSMLIFCIGVNLLWENTHIKVANMLPSIIFAIIFSFI